MGSVAQQNLFSATDLAVAPVIAVRGLRTAFGDHVVHDNLDLSVYPGEILALVGGSGTGKTVLLRQIIGLERPAAGTIEVLGRRVQELEPAERRRLSHRWGMLFQAGALFSSLSVFDNVALPLRELRTVPEDLVCDVVMCRLAMVGLTSKISSIWPPTASATAGPEPL
ncbi:ABC transporter, ATP-binding protein [Bordetella pertussis I002]|nr:ABC transporter, ATP-binding protein [Bordetella pertussis I002]